MFKNSRIFLVFVGLVVLTGLLFFGVQARVAEANFFTDFWRSLTGQLPTGAEDNTGVIPNEETEVVPLYKPALDYEEAVIAAVKKASPAVVSITISKNVPIIENCPFNPFGDLPPEFQDFFGGDFGFSQPCQKGTELKEVGGGSGFIVSSDGLIVTNKHVVSDAKASYTVFTNDGKKYNAKVLARDPVQDLAIIKIDASGLPVITLGNSDSIELGQTAIAIGNALGEFRNTVSVGVISGLSRDITASAGNVAERLSGVVQTDAAINPGNSGGPLLNLKGEVIAINTAVASDAQSVGFAIPINKAKKDIQSVKATGEIQAPFLGVRYITITADIKESQKLSVDYGALVRGDSDGPGVQPGSPADKAGIVAEDIILELGGKKISSDGTLAERVALFNVGQTVEARVLRNGKEITLKITLGKRPTE